MTTELENKLVEKYPRYFEYLKDHQGPIIPIQFGIECDNGWYWLLDQLMGEIYQYCEDNNVELPQVTQIKEKYGALCFYITGGDELIEGMIWLAESMSNKICEKCGSTENIGHTTGWITTLCEKCSKEQTLIWESDEKV